MRHAPGQPVSVTISWRSGSLTLTVVNLAGGHRYTPGAGLDGLSERLREAGGTFSHSQPDRNFRLHASLPLTRRARLRSGLASHRLGLGFAAGFVLLVILPATVLLGVH
jgi:hypothetical protein